MAGDELSVSVFISPKKKRKSEEESSAVEEDAPPPKKMWLLPQEEVDRILAESNEPVCTVYRELKRANPSLVPSPEEEKDESTMLLYTCARNASLFTYLMLWIPS
uniref:Uncharacterized protein n=1 Tax=Oryza meridionalis TaxID=40149 RepID=A0A0E0DN31_9ORYZ